MKIKNKIISLVVCLSFCLVALFNAVYFREENIKTHETVMNKTDIDYMSLLEDFDEKELIVEDDIVKLEATQYLDADFFNLIDNVSFDNKKDNGRIKYDIVFDGLANVFILKTIAIDSYGNETITETEGVPFINEYNEIDAVFVDDEGNILLSELSGGEIDNCGFFSKLKKALKVVAVAAVAVAAVAVVVAAVAACPTVGVMVTSTGAKVLAITGTIGSATTVSGALTTAAVAGTIGIAAGVGSDVINGNSGSSTIDLSKKISDIKSTVGKITTASISCAIYKQLTGLVNEALGEVYFILDNVNGYSINIYLKAVDKATAKYHMMNGGDVFTLERQAAIDVIRAIGGVYAANSKGAIDTSEVDMNGIFKHFHPYSSAFGKMKYNNRSVHSFYFKESKGQKVC